jgi:isopenicillin-N N-acyltransferase-like protein
MCADSKSPGRLVDVGGDGTARGAIHGETLRPLIGAALDRWRQDIGRRTRRDPDGYIADFLGATDFARTITDLCADLYAEVLAIARASRQPADHVLAYNLMDEEWRYGHALGGGCSVIGARVGPENTVMLAQNMDLPLSMDGSQVLLRIAADGDQPAQLVPTAAGMIGLFGVNAAGVACCVNTLSTLPCGSGGLPVAFVIRQVLTYRDAASAAGFLTSVPHASGQHYAIADRTPACAVTNARRRAARPAPPAAARSRIRIIRSGRPATPRRRAGPRPVGVMRGCARSTWASAKSARPAPPRRC